MNDLLEREKSNPNTDSTVRTGQAGVIQEIPAYELRDNVVGAVGVPFFGKIIRAVRLIRAVDLAGTKKYALIRQNQTRMTANLLALSKILSGWRSMKRKRRRVIPAKSPNITCEFVSMNNRITDMKYPRFSFIAIYV